MKVVVEHWAEKYPELVAKWLEKSYALLGVSIPFQGDLSLPVHDEPAGAADEGVKRRTKVVEIFCGPETLEKLLYLSLTAGP